MTHLQHPDDQVVLNRFHPETNNHSIKLLYQKFKGALAYLEVKLPNGNLSIGTAFHLGDGVWVTARHVTSGNRIVSMGTTERTDVRDPNGLMTFSDEPRTKYRCIPPQKLNIISGPLYHPDDKVDIALIKTLQTDIAAVKLDFHLDDWINDSAYILDEVVIMGYPPVPFSNRAVLMAMKGEINAVVDKYNGPHPHFIISTMPRGGFSGGLCLNINQFALGVVVESLIRDNKDTELGYMSVLTVEPIYICMQHHKLFPTLQKEYWGSLWEESKFDSATNTINDEQ